MEKQVFALHNSLVSAESRKVYIRCAGYWSENALAADWPGRGPGRLWPASGLCFHCPRTAGQSAQSTERRFTAPIVQANAPRTLVGERCASARRQSPKLWANSGCPNTDPHTEGRRTPVSYCYRIKTLRRT